MGVVLLEKVGDARKSLA